MNKKFKIVSSIALAGMLLTGGLGMNKVNAAEIAKPPVIDTTKVLGVYKKLVEGKTVVPIVVANTDDRATVKELVDSDLFSGEVSRINGNAVTSLDTALRTGDRVTTTDGTEFTVVVYGDVDKDGAVTILDALDIKDYSAGNFEGSFDDVQQEAADVANNGSVDIVDALYISDFVVGNQGLVAPEPAPEEVVEESNYSMTVNKGGYVNNVNEKGSQVEIHLKETLSEEEAKDTKLKLVVSDGDNDNSNDVVKEGISVTAHMDYVLVSGIDLSNFDDGTLTVSLYNGNELVAKNEIVKNSKVAPATAKVSTDRVSTRSATLSLESKGESNVTKVRYLVTLDSVTTEPKAEELTKTLDVQNNKLTDATIADDLITGKVYKVWYLVENEYGSTSGIKSALITTDGALTTEPKLEEVEAPDLTKDDVAKFTFVGKDVTKYPYVATLYKDGVAIAETEIKAGLDNVVFTSEIADAGAGTYKVSVVTKGNDKGTSESSEAVDSAEVTVTALKAVENLKIENLENDKDGNNAIVSWTNPNGKDDFGAYEIDLYTVDGEGKEKLVNDNVKCDNDKNEVKVTLATNTIYIAKVKLAAKIDQMAVVESEEVVSDQFYIVAAPSTVSSTVGSTSVKIPVTPINIPNKEVSYKVEVYTMTENGNPVDGYYTPGPVQDVTLEKVVVNNIESYQVTVTGLEPTTEYAFRLVAVVDGNEVASNYSLPVTTLPVFENVTVVADDKKDEAMVEGSNKVAAVDNKIYMNGAEYDTTSITELGKAYTVIDSLEAGDVVTMNDDATDVSIVLNGRAATRSFTTKDMFKDSTVEITSNAFTKVLSGKFKALTLSGTDSIFNVAGVEITDEDNKDIALTGNIEVTENKDRDYKVLAGSKEVMINKVNISTDEDVTLTAKTNRNLEVDANTTENDITFENTISESVEIIFVGTSDNTAEQRGKITIKTNGGKVTVSTSDEKGVNVSADMTVEVTNGDVDIQEDSLTGDKTVTVSAEEGKSSTVYANTATEAPEELVSETVNLAVYEDTDDYIRKTYGTAGQLDQDKVIAIREYINSFGLKGTKATIEVTDADTVTITLPGEAQDMEIGNIK